jgi:hypothetical protein
MVHGPDGLRARPPADIAYRLQSWYGLQVTAGQVAAYLSGPAGRPLLALPPGQARTPQSRAAGSPTGRPLLAVPADMSVAPQQAVIRHIVRGTLEVAPVIKVPPALARHLRQHLIP